MFAYTLVDTFIMASQDDKITFQRELVGHMLVESLAIGRCKDNFIVVALFLKCCYTAVDGLALHHHTSATAVWVVVNTAPLVKRVVT